MTEFWTTLKNRGPENPRFSKDTFEVLSRCGLARHGYNQARIYEIALEWLVLKQNETVV